MPRRGIELRIGLRTLMRLDDQPGEVVGWGTVTAQLARDIAARHERAEWRFAILDDHGRLMFDGITRKRPACHDGDLAPAAGGVVELHVPATMLTGQELAGGFPQFDALLADLRAQYAQQRPIEQDPTARAPGRRLRRRVQIRFQSCVGVGCNRPARECDQDHRLDHALGGRTEEVNLAPGCAYDHGLKTKRGWRLVRLDECTYRWISPLNRRHSVRIPPVAPPLPAPMPRAAADADPDPPPF